MTSFNLLFRQLFNKKSRLAYLIYLLQLAVSLIIAFLGAGTSHLSFNDSQIGNEGISGPAAFFLSWLIIFAVLTWLAEPICILLTSWRNEKINRTQTWRLLPINDGSFYLANTLSSFCVFFYLVLLQLLTALIVFNLEYAMDGRVRAAFIRVFSATAATSLPHNFWMVILSAILLVIACVLLWYIMLSFYHFAYRSLMDFLPWHNKWWLFLVRAVTLIIIVFAFSQILANAFHLFIYWGMVNKSTLFNLQVILIEIALLDLLFAGFNIYLLHHFVEAKQD